jgi:hypothetical protein
MLIAHQTRHRPGGVEAPSPPGGREIAPHPHGVGILDGARNDLRMPRRSTPPAPQRAKVVGDLGVVQRVLDVQVPLPQRVRERHASDVGQPAAGDALHPRIRVAHTRHVLPTPEAQHLGGRDAPGIPARLGSRKIGTCNRLSSLAVPARGWTRVGTAPRCERRRTSSCAFGGPTVPHRPATPLPPPPTPCWQGSSSSPDHEPGVHADHPGHANGCPSDPRSCRSILSGSTRSRRTRNRRS